MMRLHVFTLFAAAALAAHAAIPTTVEGWYTPADGFTKQTAAGKVYYGYNSQTGTWLMKDVTVDSEGNITGDDIDFKNNYTLITAYNALIKACANEAHFLRVDEAIYTMARNLNNLKLASGFSITLPTESGQGTRTYHFKFEDGKDFSATMADGGTPSATTSENYETLDGKSLEWNSAGCAQVKGWTGDHSGSTLHNLAQILSNGPDGSEKEWQLLLRASANAEMEYLSIGKLAALGSPSDEASITTNATGHKGELRLKNMDDDEDYYLPYNYAGSLLWGAPTMWDGDTVQWTKKSGGDGYVAELAGFTTGGAIGAGHYYGMAVGGNSLGFHELPNVTTNTVVADEVHLTTDLLNGGETKKFKFAIPSGGDTFLVGRDGFLPFNPDALTNGVAEVKVDNSSIATNDAGEVELKGWRDMHNGFLGKTTGGELVSKKLTPTNGLVKVDETDERFKVGIEGWGAGACSALLSSMLTDENDSNRTKHLLLAKFTDGADEKVHYVPLGDVIRTNAPPKDITINGVTGTNFVFEAADDSDVRFTVEQGADGAIHIKVGVYWK